MECLPLFAEETQRVVSLTKFQCSTGQENNNAVRITYSLASNTILQLPEGNFSSNSLQIQGIDNFTLIGKRDPETGQVLTNLKIMQPIGINFTTASSVNLIDINLEGPAGSSMVFISSNSNLVVENVELKAGNDTLYQECLGPDLGWLTPIINHLML